MSAPGAVRTPDERFDGLSGYAFPPRYLDQDGLRMHLVDKGSGDPVLLLHGEPTWSFLYRRMIPILAGRARVVAPDYFGFGRSDKPTDPRWYTYDRHVGSIERLVDQLDLRRLTGVVQDWGGPIGLRVAALHPERVARLVVMNTGLFDPASERWPTPAFLRWRAFAEAAGLDLPIAGVIRSATATEVPDEVLAGYEAPFPSRESKAGAAAFPLLVPLGPDDPGAAEMLETRRAMAEWDRPALVLFGDSDPIFSPRAAASMARLIPTAGEPELVGGAAHFLQEDRGEEIARRIARFLEQT